MGFLFSHITDVEEPHGWRRGCEALISLCPSPHGRDAVSGQRDLLCADTAVLHMQVIKRSSKKTQARRSSIKVGPHRLHARCWMHGLAGCSMAPHGPAAACASSKSQPAPPRLAAASRCKWQPVLQPQLVTVRNCSGSRTFVGATSKL